MLKLLPILFLAASAAPIITADYQTPLVVDDWYITQYRANSNDLHIFHADNNFTADDLAELEGGYVFAFYVVYNDVANYYSFLEIEYYINSDYLDRFNFIAVDFLYGSNYNDDFNVSSIGSITWSKSVYLNNTLQVNYTSWQTDEAMEQGWNFWSGDSADNSTHFLDFENTDIDQGSFFFNIALGGEYLTNQEAYNNGYQVGIQDGIQDGIQQTPTGALNWLGGMFEAIGGIFNIEIFPNVKLIYVIGIPVAVAVLAFVLKALIN